MEEKHLCHEMVCLQMLDFVTSKSNSEVSKSNSKFLMGNYFFLKNYVSSEGAVSNEWFLLSTALQPSISTFLC